jgi:flagellar basal-body rod modification protein FlgD
MSTSAITNNTVTSPTTTTSKTLKQTGSELGTNAFMKLLVSELKNQDPLNPMESRDMIAQLAQLTSVEKLDAISTGLTSLNSGIADVSNHQAPGLIGKTVSANLSQIDLGDIGSANAAFQLAGAAASVEINITDSEGQVVRTVTLGNTSAGPHQIQWDGVTKAGNRADRGRYSVGIVAKDASGKLVSCSQQLSGLVSKIIYENGSAKLIVNNSRVDLRDVLSIS